jgi:hypothetical protein
MTTETSTTTQDKCVRLDELTDAPAGVKAWLDHRHYLMGLADLEWVRGWVERTARDLRLEVLEADEAEADEAEMREAVA